ncbi:MAG TPA: hypothetical protein VGB46_10535 [Flavisolibacter sp.]|jgi:hypothetical protein
MPRVFTTDILFKGRKYRCMAAVPDDRENLPIHIRVFDPDLYDILGGNTVELKDLSACPRNCASHPLFSSLMESISDAVSRYLMR